MRTANITYPAAVFGYNGGDPAGQTGVIDYVIASTTLTAGFVVIIDTATAGKVTSAATNSATQLVVGTVAAQNGKATYASGDVVPVVIGGRAIGKVATTVTAGDRLGLDATNAGRLASITAGAAVTQAQHLGQIVAVAEESVATASNTDVKIRIVHF